MSAWFSKVIAAVITEILKDLGFMIANMLKVRKIRKEREDAAKKATEAYKEKPTDENFGKLP